MKYIVTPALVAGAVLFAGAAVVPNDARAQTTLVIRVAFENPTPARPHGPIRNLKEFGHALAGCWRPPPVDQHRQPADVIFQISFTRSGELFGKPHFIEFVRDVTPEQRGSYYEAVAEALDRCSPMPFTDSMGDAAAGRVFRIDIVDMRNSKRAEIPQPTASAN